MKRILPIFLCVLLLVGVFVVPVSAANTGSPLLDGTPYEFWDGYSYRPVFLDAITGDEILLHANLAITERFAFITYTSTNGAYLFIFDGYRLYNTSSSPMVSLEGVTEYFYQNNAWVKSNSYVSTAKSLSSIKWSSFNLEADGVIYFRADPLFLPVPLAEQIQGVAEEQLTEKTLPTLAETILTIVTIAVGCLALVISLVILVRVLRTVLPR